ncbi:related to Chromatin modification-related protein eaf-6 [Rhynchosporium secalis]|uniref:Chromatin modification-related protein EAF6 n=1 Tax=Rhynchosporium secalis TaxID=38038 RepID=A0A1E1M119_RHYSE|nr:related to Chromatin modification-related protein eaf-6 [Rhynchosporium secalis]
MAENPHPTKPPSATADVPGQPFYDKTRHHLRALLAKRREIEAKLQAQESEILRKETEYLEETPHGNIIIGFEGYTKGVSVVPGQRLRRPMVLEGNRVFSRSSVSYGNGGGDSPTDTAQSTPAATAPTPLSATFLKGEGGSNHATPSSATSATKSGAGSRKNKKGTANGAGAQDDSDTDTRDSKKARTNFGAVGRK